MKPDLYPEPQFPRFSYILGANNADVSHTSPFATAAGRLRRDGIRNHVLKAINVIQLCVHCFTLGSYSLLCTPQVPDLTSVMELLECIKCLAVTNASVCPQSSSPTRHKGLLCCVGLKDLIIGKSRRPLSYCRAAWGSCKVIVQ